MWEVIELEMLASSGLMTMIHMSQRKHLSKRGSNPRNARYGPVDVFTACQEQGCWS